MLGFDLSSAATLQRYRTEFEQIEKIGSGGFSTVYRVRNKRDGQEYALKIVKIKPSQYKGSLPDYLERVLGEARLLAGLKHPNVLQYHGCWIDGDLESSFGKQSESAAKEKEGDLQLVMYEDDSVSECGVEFESESESSDKKKSGSGAKGEKMSDSSDYCFFGTDLRKYRELRVYFLSELANQSLQKFMQNRNLSSHKTPQQKKQSKVENYQIILDVISGLIYIHSQKIIHRDIKPQNIVQGKDGRFKIIDFGLAKKVRGLEVPKIEIPKFEIEEDSSEDDLEKHSSSVGTRIFSSPEQSCSSAYDYRTDIFSLALVIGVLFSDFKTAHEEKDVLDRLHENNLEGLNLDDKLQKLMVRCLSEEVHRPELKELKTCIKELLRGLLTEDENRENGKTGRYCSLWRGSRVAGRMPLQERGRQNEEVRVS